MEKVKQHFEAEAKEFDNIIIKLIPFYEHMIDCLVSAIHFDEHEEIKVIDLGCGTGTIARKISERYKNTTIECLDMASNMIELAKIKMANHHKTKFSIKDFSAIRFSESYDVVVSSLALHHLETDEQKRGFYEKIYEALNNKGMFLNADVILASSHYWQDLNMKKWIGYMNRSVPMQEILTNWIPKYESEDRPAILIDQIEWLKEIGFKNVDVIWKYYNFGVYGGIK